MTDYIGYILMTMILRDRVILRPKNIATVCTNHFDSNACICMSSNYIPDEEWLVRHQLKLKIANKIIIALMRLYFIQNIGDIRIMIHDARLNTLVRSQNGR